LATYQNSMKRIQLFQQHEEGNRRYRFLITTALAKNYVKKNRQPRSKFHLPTYSYFTFPSLCCWCNCFTHFSRSFRSKTVVQEPAQKNEKAGKPTKKISPLGALFGSSVSVTPIILNRDDSLEASSRWDICCYIELQFKKWWTYLSTDRRRTIFYFGKIKYKNKSRRERRNINTDL